MNKYAFIFMFFVLLFVQYKQSYGQERPIISAGFGAPELINMGIRIPMDQIQLGISAGGYKFNESAFAFAFSGDLRYYFGGNSKFSDRRPWYGKVGFNYFRDENKYDIDKYFYFTTRIGREFSISRKFGIEFDLGAIFELQHIEIIKVPLDGFGLGPFLDFPILPSLSTSLYYKF